MTETETGVTAATGRRLRRRIGLASLATLVGMLGGLAALFDWFEGRVGDPPATTIETKILSARLEPTRMMFGDFLRERKISTAGLSRHELREEGLIFSVEVRLQGNLGKTLELRWRLYRADGTALKGRLYDQPLGKYEPANQNHERRAFFWVPYPPRPGTYFAQFTLVDEDRTPIDDINTDPFRIARVPP